MILRVKNDLKEAMKEKNVIKKGTLQLLLADLQREEKESKKELTDEKAIEIVQRKVKQTRQALEEFKKADRLDLVDQSKIEIEILEVYLPKQLSEEEITSIITNLMASLNIVKGEVNKKGLLMKELMPKVKGKADGKLVNEIVIKLL